VIVDRKSNFESRWKINIQSIFGQNKFLYQKINFSSSFQNYHNNQNQKNQSDTARSVEFKCTADQINGRKKQRYRLISCKFSNTSGSGNFFFLLFLLLKLNLLLFLEYEHQGVHFF
jgi:hypothetical protein